VSGTVQHHITNSGVRALELSCTNLVIMRRALVIEAEIFKLPKGFRCSVPIKFNGMRASKSHPQINFYQPFLCKGQRGEKKIERDGENQV